MSEGWDRCEDLSVCDCCYAMVDELVDAGGHAQCIQCSRIADLETKLAAAEEELTRFRNGYKGSCYACETVGEKNVELEAKLAAAEAECKAESEKARVLRGALRELVRKRHDMDLAWFFADEMLATTEEQGE